ncbi:hypothetical protein [Paracidovorax cattleyae]|uniref:Uncharacterized protein n=2 Tax=Paracidovorax cattleyae TaxID=80868 RepID=A0A1H0TBD4_9BURK|nr:hypothetical protein [Paracidovorax cattleyae]SDP51337.1 hypothetical protein SAMN04489708_114127 [Paracidovorax cattleyae]
MQAPRRCHGFATGHTASRLEHALRPPALLWCFDLSLIMHMVPIHLNPFSRKKNRGSQGESSSQAAERASRQAPRSAASEHLPARQGARSAGAQGYAPAPRLERLRPIARCEYAEQLTDRAVQSHDMLSEGPRIGRGSPHIDHRINPPNEEEWQNLFDADSAERLGLEDPEWAQVSQPRLERLRPIARCEYAEQLTDRAVQSHDMLSEGPRIGRGSPHIDHRINPPNEEEWQNLFDADSAERLGLEDPEWAQVSQAGSPSYGDATPAWGGQAAGAFIDLRSDPDARVDSLPESMLRSLGTALGLPDSTGYPPAPALAEGIRQRLAELDMGVFSVYDDLHVLNMDRDTPLRRKLGSSDRHTLAHLATKTHMTIRQTPVTPAVPGGPSYRVSIYFDGVPDGSKQQNGTTLKGDVGRVYRMACEAAQLVAQALQADPTVQVSHICGLSTGGGSAQMFAAALQSHLPQAPRPALVLLDPMLLNPKQKAHAMAQGPHACDFTQPRGIALTLDYAGNPRKCLMDRQQAIGRSSEGLVRLRLGLTDRDGLGGTPPQPHGPPGTGYHSNRHHYEAALSRFTA